MKNMDLISFLYSPSVTQRGVGPVHLVPLQCNGKDPSESRHRQKALEPSRTNITSGRDAKSGQPTTGKKGRQ